MNIKKRLFAILLSAAMVFTCMPFAVFADENDPAGATGDEWEYEGQIPVDATIQLEGEYGYTIDDLNKQLYWKWTEDNHYYSQIYVYSEGDAEETLSAIYAYGEYEYVDEDGNKQIKEGFLREGADPADELAYANVVIDEEKFAQDGGFLKPGYNTVHLIFYIPYKNPDTGEYGLKEILHPQDIWVEVNYPIKVEFIPADGFKLNGVIGYNYIDEEDFYGEGNIFRVTINWTEEDGRDMQTVADYIYVKTSDVEGFYDHGNPEYERFDMYDGLECYLSKGLNKDITLTYNSYVKWQEEPTPLEFKVDINADKYGVYANKSYYSYTGKAIQPKFKVYNTEDKLIPAKEYTVSKAKAKSIGWHTVTIKIKDEYKSKYNVTSFKASYSIGPKKPVLTKVTAGKKRLTVKWKKFTKSQLKKMDGMVIEVSTDKHFLNGVKTVKVSKSQLKKGSKLVKGLKKGKKYYVRTYTYKTVSKNGVKDKIRSPYSKVSTKKTK